MVLWSGRGGEGAGFEIGEGGAPMVGNGDGSGGSGIEVDEHGGGHALDFARVGITHLLHQCEALVAHLDALRKHLNGLGEHGGTKEVHIDIGNDEAAVVDFEAIVGHPGEVVDLCEVEEGEIGIVVHMLVHIVVGVTQLHCCGAVKRCLNLRDWMLVR